MYTENNMSIKAICNELGMDFRKVKKVLIDNDIELVRKPRSDIDTSGKTQINKKYYIYKQGASRRGYEFDLTLDEFKEKLFGNCVYCGQEPNTEFTNSPGRRYSHYITINTVDRVDNSIGYTNDNTVSCCKMCNSMKSDYTVDEFREHVNKIARYNNVTN